MPLVGVKANAGAFGLGWSAVLPGEELGGMVLLTPTSIAYTGTSATIEANGSVSFTAVDPLNINGVFSADYDNYRVVVSGVNAYSGARWDFRLRASGTDNSTASSYVYQVLQANSTTVAGSRSTNSYSTIQIADTTVNAVTVDFYGPYLTQPTAWRTVGVNFATTQILDYATTHNQSTAYDGFSIIPHVLDFTGTLSVYGLVGA